MIGLPNMIRFVDPLCITALLVYILADCWALTPPCQREWKESNSLKSCIPPICIAMSAVFVER